MNAFEDIVARYLEEKGYWVRQSVKVHITKADKVVIGTPSMPTPEIDLVAFNTRRNELLLVEVKSYLDSYGVWLEAVNGKDVDAAARYKLFTNPTFRRIVTDRLVEDYLNLGLVKKGAKIGHALAAGNIHAGNEAAIASYFKQQGWKLFTPEEIKSFVKRLVSKPWSDDLITMTAKLAMR